MQTKYSNYIYYMEEKMRLQLSRQFIDDSNKELLQGTLKAVKYIKIKYVYRSNLIITDASDSWRRSRCFSRSRCSWCRTRGSGLHSHFRSHTAPTEAYETCATMLFNMRVSFKILLTSIGLI